MNEEIWVSKAMVDQRLLSSLKSDSVLRSLQGAADAEARNNRGEPLVVTDMPQELYGVSKNGLPNSLSTLFFASGFLFVSKICAVLLREFDLGVGGLYPVNLFQKDRQTKVAGEYFCLNFGTTKKTFLPEHSPRARNYRDQNNTWSVPFVMNNDDITVSTSALEGADLWVDTTPLLGALFASGRLVSVLREANLDKPFNFCSCKITQS